MNRKYLVHSVDSKEVVRADSWVVNDHDGFVYFQRKDPDNGLGVRIVAAFNRRDVLSIIEES